MGEKKIPFSARKRAAHFLFLSGPWRAARKSWYIDQDERISDVKLRVATVMKAHTEEFYLTFNGKIMADTMLVAETGITRDMMIRAHGRIRGGATYGALHCSFCKRGGCWASKPFCFRCGQMRQDVPAESIFVPNGYKGNFREQQHMGRSQKAQPSVNPTVHGPNVGRAPYFTSPKKPVKVHPRAKQNADDATQGQPLDPDAVLAVLQTLSLPGELLEEVRRRIPVPKPPEKKKERALADLRDKLNKERKHLERLDAHARKKRQEADEAMERYNVKLDEVTAIELEAAPTSFPSPNQTGVIIEELPHPVDGDVEEFISDIDLAFGDDRGSVKRTKAAPPPCGDPPPDRDFPKGPPRPYDIECAVNGGNYETEDLRKLRDLLDDRMRKQERAVSIQSTPICG